LVVYILLNTRADDIIEEVRNLFSGHWRVCDIGSSQTWQMGQKLHSIRTYMRKIGPMATMVTRCYHCSFSFLDNATGSSHVTDSRWFLRASTRVFVVVVTTIIARDYNIQSIAFAPHAVITIVGLSRTD